MKLGGAATGRNSSLESAYRNVLTGASGRRVGTVGLWDSVAREGSAESVYVGNSAGDRHLKDLEPL